MLKINSYIKADDFFYEIGDFSGHIKDVDYVEGALHISVNGIDLLTTDEWDYIDQLWAYMVDGMLEVNKGNSFEFYFPDQPIQVSFLLQGREKVLVTVFVNEKKSALISLVEFNQCFKKSAQDFFRKMIELLPEHKDTYQDCLISVECV